MFRFLLSIFFLTASCYAAAEQEDLLLPSSPEQIATLSSSFLVKDLVSPLSGQLCLQKIDLVAKGAQELTLSRSYIPPFTPVFDKREDWDLYEGWQYHLKTYRGWLFLPHLYLSLITENGSIVRLTEPNGMTLDYSLSNLKESKLLTPLHAISNMVGESPSGKYDPRNTRIELKGKQILVHSRDGVVRHYVKAKETSFGFRYLLEKEILPNGCCVRVHYANMKPTLIESTDPKERVVYASIGIEEGERTPLQRACHFFSSSGTSASYQFQLKERAGTLEENKMQRTFKQTSHPLLSQVSSPFYREERIDYSERLLLKEAEGQTHYFRCHYGTYHEPKGQPPQFRMGILFLPSGPEGSFSGTTHFYYEPPLAGKKEGKTTVTQTEGTVLVYHFSPELLVTKIQFYTQDGALKKQHCYEWDKQHWLSAMELRDGDNHLFFKKSYDYDAFGNPIVETFSGDLKGEGNFEHAKTMRTFSQDGRHLLLREEEQNGKVTRYQYLPGTNLVTAKWIQEKEKILLREFLSYDDYNQLIQKIEDDGQGENKDDLTGVTYRKITALVLRQQQPFLHLPEWIEERYLEEGQEKLLKSRHFSYDRFGNICQEDVYDADRKYAYSLFKEYNEAGQLLSETNPLGQKATYYYDNKGRRIAEINHSRLMHKTMCYDIQGRLCQEIEAGSGLEHQTHHRYDLEDRLVQTIDSFGNSTSYAYDPIAQRIASTESPPVPSGPVKTSAIYDAAGRPISKTDANGQTTTFRYNAYGSPTEICYPDGTKEHFHYSRNGSLKRQTNQEGVVTHYMYDVLGRVLSKTFMLNHEQLAQETFVYKGLNLIQTTDREGHTTCFSYDGVGRKIEENRSGRITRYDYDSLGRLCKIIQENGANTLITHFTRDLLDRVLAKSQTDLAGNLLYRIFYSYDADGNLETVTKEAGGTDTYTYDAFHRLLRHRDPFGYCTKTTYHEDKRNALGQKVLQTITLDPKSRSTQITYDPYGREVSKKIVSFDKTIFHHEKVYDPCGNLLFHIDIVYPNENTQTVKYTYTPLHQIKSLTRAWNTPCERTTTFTYTPTGKIASETRPDVTTLFYTYTPLGFLKQLHSSDATLLQTFETNRLGQLISAKEQSSSIQRELDPFGNALKETFSTGLSLEKTYDQFDRPLSLTLPDGKITYTYNPLYLTTVSRHSDKETYTHSYTEYDLSGHLTKENLINGLGQVIHHLDLKERETTLLSPFLYQQCSYDEEDNLIQNSLNNNTQQFSYDDLSQIISEPGIRHRYDSLGNRLQKNEWEGSYNELNELLSLGNIQCQYDLRGNLIGKKTPEKMLSYHYDSLNRLTSVSDGKNECRFVYDPLGRKLSRYSNGEQENYLYNGEDEIGAFTSEKVTKQLRILGIKKAIPAPVALELGGKVYVPIQDIQGNSRGLVDPSTQSIVETYEFTAFGESAQTAFNPWRYASKRLDPTFSLIDFGKRFYDPELSRWLTTDPAGFVDGSNLYLFLRNNPFRYVDPDGQFVFAIALPIIEFSFGAAGIAAFTVPTIATVATTALCYGIYQGVCYYNQRMNSTSHENVLEEERTKEEKKEKKSKRTEPRDLPEQLTLEEAKAGAGKEIMEDKEMKDPRYPKDEWMKIQHIHTTPSNQNINIHYWENIHTGEREGFKFKNN